MIAIDFPLRFQGGSLRTTTSYPRIVRAQIVDTLMTNYRERVMRPEYGSDIHALLMSPQDVLRRNDTARILKDRLATSVPRAFIDKVDILPSQGGPSTLVIQVRYRVNEYSETESLDVPIVTTTLSGST